MKRPLRFCKTYVFSGDDYSHPLRAMAQWVERHPGVDVIAVNVSTSWDDGYVEMTVYVALTVEDVRW